MGRSSPDCCCGFRIEEIELRRLGRAESGVDGEGMLSASVFEKLRFREWAGGREPSGGGYWDSSADMGAVSGMPGSWECCWVEARRFCSSW